MVKKAQRSAVVKVTSKNQITVLKVIREALRLQKQDNLKRVVSRSGKVVEKRVATDDFWTEVSA